ncbi:MAG TPA: hypothetical protein VMW01_08775 [Williamwhitmania sp.]|nr:hypothetical protein [Williamwhitmania sp.]
MIELPSFLCYPPLISGLLLVLIIATYKWTFKSTFRKFWISFSQFLIIYTLIVGSAASTEIKIKKDLEKYELNNEGLYSEKEAAVLYEATMDRLINDVGRNFTVFTGLFISGIFSLITYFVLWGYDKYKRLKKEDKEITTHNPQ